MGSISQHGTHPSGTNVFWDRKKSFSIAEALKPGVLQRFFGLMVIAH